MPGYRRNARWSSGKGLGERLAELAVYAALAVGLFMAYRWYRFTYLGGPSYTLTKFLGAVKDGNPDGQYPLVSDTVRQQFPTVQDYTKGFPEAQGLAGRLADFTVTKLTDLGEKAEANVNLRLRRPNQELYQNASDTVEDHYVLRKEADGWRVDLTASRLPSLAHARQQR